MPTNLPPDYYHLERRFREASLPEEKAELIEEMLSVIPKHKGTDHLRADLRAKLAKLRASSGKSESGSRSGSAYHIDREGAGQVVLLGGPNVGKSALVAALTNAQTEVAEYAYATWTPVPGMMHYENVPIQLIDTPSLNPEYVEPEFTHLLRGADLVVIVVDLQGFPIEQLEEPLAFLSERRIAVHAAGSPTPPSDALERGAVPKPLLVVVNKVDDARAEEDFAVLCELLEGAWPLVPISVAAGRNLDGFQRAVFEALGIIRVFPKPPGRPADMEAPFTVKRGTTVEEFAGKVHRDFLTGLKSARVWGSSQFDGQMVVRDYVLQDGDIVELRT